MMTEQKKGRQRPTTQIYKNYTAEDRKVWKTLFERQSTFLEGKVSKAFSAAVEKVGFEADTIPNFEEVNRRLAATTGWELVTVPNISPVDAFFKFLSNKQFTATCWLRRFKELDYLEEPDMFHDVFGHTPMLTNQAYCDFFQSIGNISLKYLDNQVVVTKLQRLYWFTIEFGLIREGSDLKIYGAGIISSKGEAAHALSELSTKKEFDLKAIFEQDFRTDILQDVYYVIDSFEQLAALPEAIEKALFED